MNENYIPEEYTPISMWGYFGYSLSSKFRQILFLLADHWAHHLCFSSVVWWNGCGDGIFKPGFYSHMII